MSDKRKDYISWDEYFMGVAKLSALRSKDPNTQVGACIVSSDNKILLVNTPPRINKSSQQRISGRFPTIFC